MQNKPTLDQRSFVVGLGKTEGGAATFSKLKNQTFWFFRSWLSSSTILIISAPITLSPLFETFSLWPALEAPSVCRTRKTSFCHPRPSQRSSSFRQPGDHIESIVNYIFPPHRQWEQLQAQWSSGGAQMQSPEIRKLNLSLTFRRLDICTRLDYYSIVSVKKRTSPLLSLSSMRKRDRIDSLLFIVLSWCLSRNCEIRTATWREIEAMFTESWSREWGEIWRPIVK